MLTNCLFCGNPDGDVYDADTALTYTGASAIDGIPDGLATGTQDGDPEYLSGPSGTWDTVVYNAGTNRTTLTATTAAFAGSDLRRALINPNTANRWQALVLANTDTTVQVVGDMQSKATAGDAFAVVNYHLTATSAAIDSGTASGAPATDLDGESRPVDSFFDIGVDEFLDSDDDDLADVVETDTGVYVGAWDTGTDPGDPDSDGDGYSDGDEVEAGTDPLDPGSAPGPGLEATPTFGEPTLRVSFTTADSVAGEPVTAWSWDFGDGTPGSTEQNPMHDYTGPGSFDVTVTLTTASGDTVVVRPSLVNVADPSSPASGPVDLTGAVVVTQTGDLPAAEQMAAILLVEEVQERTGLTWATTNVWPGTGTIIAITSQTEAGPPVNEEGYHLFVQAGGAGPTVVWVIGGGPRGALYGVGKLLRSLEWSSGSALLAEAPNVTTEPVYEIRGHQIGYRHLANSYDAWDRDQYEQYIRELVIFGANCIENIPFADNDSPHFQITPDQMALEMSAICAGLRHRPLGMDAGARPDECHGTGRFAGPT